MLLAAPVWLGLGCEASAEDVCQHRATIMEQRLSEAKLESCTAAIWARRKRLGAERYRAFVACSLAASDRTELIQCERDD